MNPSTLPESIAMILRESIATSAATVISVIAPVNVAEESTANTAIVRPFGGREGESGPPDRTVYRVELDRVGLAKNILAEAIQRYRATEGYEGYLVDAAWQLQQIGKDAWSVLRDTVASSSPESEYFLATIVRMPNIPPNDRIKALRFAAKNCDANVRGRLLELVDEMTENHRSTILHELAAPQRPDDDVTDRARELLAHAGS